MSALLNDLAAGEKDLLGPAYDYSSKIPSPGDLGVSGDGTMDATMKNIGAGMTYVDYLITGPNLGNKYWLPTGAQCTAPDGKTLVDRYRYIDNTADQLSQAGISSFSKFASKNLQGLLPGIVAGLEDLNPMGILGALVEEAYPACKKVSCPTGDVTGSMTGEAQYARASEADGLIANAGCTAEAFGDRKRPNANMGFLMLLLPVAIIVGLHYIPR